MAAIFFGSTMELVVLPSLFILAGRWINETLAGRLLLAQRVSEVAALICFLIGVPWLAASITYQHWKGDGTPFPLVPTKRLVIQGPYRYTRNPMALGAIFWLLGWGMLSNNAWVLLLGVGGFSALVLSYDHFIEERELSRRFGSDYESYRKSTPFLLPKPL